jgi:hypothetical protein
LAKKKKVLFVCGTLNQTTQLHQVAGELPEVEPYFTPYYCDGYLRPLRAMGFLDFTAIGRPLRKRCVDYLYAHDLRLDPEGRENGPEYELVVTCSDLLVQKNLRRHPILLVQEGILDPPNWLFWLWKHTRLVPRWMGGTAVFGLSDRFDRFCVASEGYRRHFIAGGADPDKLVVTGIPNFDNCKKFLHNDFPHRDYFLVCTSDARETYKLDNRKKFIRWALELARGRPLLFKLHPNEKKERAIREIRELAPDALIYTDGCAEEMVANSAALLTQYSSTTFVGLALGKEVHSLIDLEKHRELTPLQNGGRSARSIAQVAREMLGLPSADVVPIETAEREVRRAL